MTTSAARCRLYGFLDQVVKNNGELLYMDTGTSINLGKNHFILFRFNDLQISRSKAYNSWELSWGYGQ